MCILDVKQRHTTSGFQVQTIDEKTHQLITWRFSLWSQQPVQAADVILAISKLKNIKSTGYDQINLQHRRKSNGYNSIHTLIVNTSIATKVFPKPWKHSIIIPIHKSGDIEEPIHLLPILSKILEKVIAPHLTESLEKIIYKMNVNMPITIIDTQKKH